MTFLEPLIWVPFFGGVHPVHCFISPTIWTETLAYPPTTLSFCSPEMCRQVHQQLKTNISTFTRTHTLTHTQTRIHPLTHTHTYKPHTHTHTQRQTHQHTHTPAHTHTHTHTHTHSHTCYYETLRLLKICAGKLHTTVYFLFHSRRRGEKQGETQLSIISWSPWGSAADLPLNKHRLLQAPSAVTGARKTVSRRLAKHQRRSRS